MTPMQAQVLADAFGYDVVISGGKAHVYMGETLLWTKEII